MIWFRPPTQYGRAAKRWDDTPLCHEFELKGYLARIWVKHFFPTLGLVPANDTDHLPW